MRHDLTISRLGSQGDGIADTADGPVYVPFVLPGEQVTAEVSGGRGELLELRQPAPERQAPVCRHFGVCGGCVLQHLAPDAYHEWKRQRVVEALRAEHIETEVATPLMTGAGSRRRAALSAVKAGGKLALGFRRAQSHDIVDLEECPVLVPRLAAALPGLRALLAAFLHNGEARVQLMAADNGLDVLIENDADRPPTFKTAHGEMAEALGIIRITAGGNPIFSLGQPQIALSGVAVDLPPGAFLQAAGDAETAMAALVVEAMGKARKVADLFCGLGTFTFAMGRKASVTAVESDRTLLAALEMAARRAPGLKPVKTLRRDLMREPLAPLELNAFDAVLFDPPRAGAYAQAKTMAKSRLAKVVAVSCNPATFARDARVLIDGGFMLKRVVPVDQFVYSAHVELVAVFARK